MTLNAWDFGGQEIYHATHQFFLTNRSVFVVVWNARLGFEQGRLYYWLDTVQALAPESPVVLVATHTDQRDAALPLEDLRRRYPQIVGHWSVSNLTRSGVDAVRGAISRSATSVPLMGQAWPGAWLRAAEGIRRQTENWISPRKLRASMSGVGVGSDDQQVLARWLHELGDVLYFQDDEELRDTVILKPEWVTRSMSKVLESERVKEGLGIFNRDDMDVVWADIDVGLRDHFLRLMERFDLSYRTLENREISIVVERLQLDPPDGCFAAWDAVRSQPGCKEISMKFQFGTMLPAGIPTWFIARSHRFTTHSHWRYGAVFADRPEKKHLALVQAHPHDRYVRLTVRGPQPQNFFALLREGLELTIRRYPGIRVSRTMPCPCCEETPNSCSYEFDLGYLERAIEQVPPVLEVQCQRSFSMVSIMGLLFGVHWRLQDKVLEQIDAMRGDVQELLQLTQREFLNQFRRDQASADADCPNVFTLSPIGQLQTLRGTAGRGFKDDYLFESLQLQLFCQAPGHWHPALEGGTYTIHKPHKWIETLAPYLKALLSVLKYSAKAKGSLLIDVKFRDHVKFMDTLVQRLPVGIEQTNEPTLSEGADLRVLHSLLHQLDERHQWGGLTKMLTPEGHYLWLCREHAAEYRG